MTTTNATGTQAADRMAAQPAPVGEARAATVPFGESPAFGPETGRASASGAAAPQVTTRFCSNCEEDVEPGGKGHCPSCGRFLPDNAVAVTHGGRRLSLPPERASRRSELLASVLTWLGGPDSPIVVEIVQDFVSACVLRDQIVEHLESIGPLTQRGTRRAAMDLYLATSARIERLSAMLSGFRSGMKDAPTPSDITLIETIIIDPGYYPDVPSRHRPALQPEVAKVDVVEIVPAAIAAAAPTRDLNNGEPTQERRDLDMLSLMKRYAEQHD